MNKIVLVGCGNVGMAYAYGLILNETNIDELVLIDIDKTKVEGEVLDLQHASVYRRNKCKISVGNYKSCKNAKMVVITAGKSQAVGETRNDLIIKNLSIMKSIITEIKKSGFNGIYLVASNPLDAMTYATMKLSNSEPNKVLGSGTTLDTARLKALISAKININADNIHAYVIGEHGDSETIAWTNARVGANSIDDYIDKNQKQEILTDVRQSAYEIINRKGNTAYGIGVCLVKITDAILNDDNTIMTVSSYNSNLGFYYGCPSILNNNGVKEQISLKLNKKEQAELSKSLKAIEQNIKYIDKNL